jgi:hypothetical protein
MFINETDILLNTITACRNVMMTAIDLRTGKRYEPPSFELPYLAQRNSLLEQIRADRVPFHHLF